jgi:malate/lactate dehydrogenase
MCVVDRRGGQGDYARAQAALQHQEATLSVEAGVIPACVETEEASSHPNGDEQEGVPVVEGTPGIGALLQIMLERVWGIQADEESLAAGQLLV